MGFQRVKYYRLRCDRCRRFYIHLPPFVSEWESDILASTNEYEKPKLRDGWEYKTISDRGLTGYTSTDIHCPECVDKDDRHQA